MSDDIPNLVRENSILVDRRLVSMRYCSEATKAFVPQSINEHLSRAKFVKERILLSAGLNPVPEMLDLCDYKFSVSNEHIYEDVRIFDVRAEPVQGVLLTGNLFLPLNATEQNKVPGILCPHGHWDRGRVHHAERGGVSMRCFQLARLGFAVFSYDMAGYNDNNKLKHWIENGMRRNPELSGVSLFGLQTYNSMRALDFLCSRAEVDAEKIGCTGASGGASQTWFLAAIDQRVKVLAPVCMLSSHFQGGCACEEGPLLRNTGLTSFDVVAAVAPRRIMLPSVTGDWTNLNPQYELPKLKEVYKLYSAEDNVEAFHYVDEHNYNKRTREHVYAFFVRHLLGKDFGDVIPEENIPPPSPELLWHGGVEPVPATDEIVVTTLQQLEHVYTADALNVPSDKVLFKKARVELLKQMLDDGRGEIKDVVYRVFGPTEGWGVAGGSVRPYTLSRRGVGDYLTSIDITSDSYAHDGQIDLILANGDYHEYFGSGSKASVVKQAMLEGKQIRIAELLGTGSNKWQMKYAIRDNQSPDCYGNFSTAFEESYFSMRVHDALTNIVQLKEAGYKEIKLYAEGNSVPVALAAAVLSGCKAFVDVARVDESIWLDELSYHPLIKRIGGLAGLLLLNEIS